MRPLHALFALSLSVFLSGCAIGRAASPLAEIPRERATECQDICTKLGLRMSAVVIIMNNAGCVCEPGGTPVPAGGAVSGVATRGGGATIAAVQTMATQQAQQNALR